VLPLGDWYCTLFFVDRRKCLLFTSSTTLFSVLVPGVRRADLANLGGLFRSEARRALSDAGCPPEVIAEWLVGPPDEIGKTVDRRVLGSMNDYLSMIAVSVASEGALDPTHRRRLEWRLAKSPKQMLGMDSALERLTALVEQRGMRMAPSMLPPARPMTPTPEPEAEVSFPAPIPLRPPLRLVQGGASKPPPVELEPPEEPERETVATPSFVPLHLTRSHAFELPLSAERSFELFTPLGERLWVPGWNPQFLFPTSGALQPGGVFTTRGSGDTLGTIWIVNRVDRLRLRIEYCRVTPESRVAVVEIHVGRVGPETSRVWVRYTFTALSEAGNAYLDALSPAHFAAEIEAWRQMIHEHLAGERRG